MRRRISPKVGALLAAAMLTAGGCSLPLLDGDDDATDPGDDSAATTLDPARDDDSSGDGSPTADTSDEPEVPSDPGELVNVTSMATTIEPDGYQLMSTMANDPAGSLGAIRVDQAFTATRLVHWTGDVVEPGAGNELVVIDYQLFFDRVIGEEAFRLVVGDTVHDLLYGISEEGDPLDPTNDRLVFEVPAGTDRMTLETGTVEGEEHGGLSRFDLGFEPHTGVPFGYQARSWDGDIEATDVGGDGREVTMAVSRSTPDLLVEPLTARLTDEYGELVSHPGTKLVAVELQLTTLRRAQVYSSAIRLRADDEWYHNFVFYIDQPDTEATARRPAVFEVPIETSEFLLEVGGVGTILGDGLWPGEFGRDYADAPSGSWELQFPDS